MTEHEHEWYLIRWITVDHHAGVWVQCEDLDCNMTTLLSWAELDKILNNPTVKTIINVVLARRGEKWD